VAQVPTVDALCLLGRNPIRQLPPAKSDSPMSSRVRDLAEFLRDDKSIWCGAVEGTGSTDPYEAAAKRILVCVHQSELPVAGGCPEFRGTSVAVR